MTVVSRLNEEVLRVRENPVDADQIVASLELAAERCEDLTPLVYERLFRERPETRALFRTEGSTLVKGSMLELALDAVLDFAGERKAAHRMIFCEVQSHAAYGTSPELFNVFFAVIADTVRELIGAGWTAEIDRAWRVLLDELDRYVKDAVQAANIA
jgi:hemoglobin-like flavoprotein